MQFQKYSKKFYLGIFAIVLSLVIGKITTITFFFYYEQVVLRWSSLLIYIASWPLLIYGIVWVGKEYEDAVRKYISYRFYKDSLHEGTKKALIKTKEKSKVLREHVVKKLNERKDLRSRRKEMKKT